MRIASVRLQGFRNFRDAFVNFNEKSLVIGYNDVGKTNLVYALRLLLDRTLPESALEPRDSDFYVHQPTNTFSIDIHLVDVVEDCLVSRFGEYLTDEGDLHLVYEASRDPVSERKRYEVKAGPADALETLSGRFYLKYLNLRVVEGKRDLLRFIRRERRALLEEAKEARTVDQREEDVQLLKEVDKRLKEANAAIMKLNYVGSATNTLNVELSKLSYRHASHQLVFGTGGTDSAEFVENLELLSRVQNSTIAVGGDGRHNQIQLALWTARNQIAAGEQADPEEVSVYCIEEPEAHLHPHQQRKLAAYLANTLGSQVILTTHSAQIASEFPPESLIRLYQNDLETVAAAAGCSDLIQAEVVRFGFRMSILPAEAFFASAVLLVEGPSELLFYRALARAIGIDLDRMNVSILSVDGVGFDVYCNLLTALSIPFSVRTDNDVFKIPNVNAYHYAGIERALELAKRYRRNFDHGRVVDLDLLQGFDDPQQIPDPNRRAAETMRSLLAEYGVFVAQQDLENDLCSAHAPVIFEYTRTQTHDAAVRRMQGAKANFMFSFLRMKAETLADLAGSHLAAPLVYCQELVQG
ncbi:MAG TPA: AAA family ATPase [Longimicrobiaceae bacterium]|nr:AAA family ATPase [Longimicrobiaceae bacterium]